MSLRRSDTRRHVVTRTRRIHSWTTKNIGHEAVEIVSCLWYHACVLENQPHLFLHGSRNDHPSRTPPHRAFVVDAYALIAQFILVARYTEFRSGMHAQDRDPTSPSAIVPRKRCDKARSATTRLSTRARKISENEAPRTKGRAFDVKLRLLVLGRWSFVASGAAGTVRR
jgi:hypothetical protein